MPKSYIFESAKHGNYIAVNCGAIPEEQSIANYSGMKKVLLLELTTIEKDIFEVADGGPIFG